MKPITRLTVDLRLEGQSWEVGELALVERRVFFKYAPAFLESGLLLSPFKLPLSPQPQEAGEAWLDGLYGVFYDSLPDGWGRLLLDRALQSKGIPLSSIGSLDRLHWVGSAGSGALCYRPAADSQASELQHLQLDRVAAEAQRLLEGTDTLALGDLVRMGGTSGGARPKVLVGFNPATGHLLSFSEDLPAGYEHWIVKFPAAADAEDVAQIEYAYYQMALEAGLEMSECRLFEGPRGQVYFGTKRFDRLGNQRLHLHSAAGLMHDNFRMSSMDYGHLMDAAFRLERHVGAHAKVLRLAAFNIYAHNRDDHSKNVSFLMDAQGQWRLAPAYDLTCSYASHGQHSITVAGEGRAPGLAHLRQLAKLFAAEGLDSMVEQVRAAVANWEAHASSAGVGRRSKADVRQALRQVAP